MTHSPLPTSLQILSLFSLKKINREKILESWIKNHELEKGVFLSRSAWSLALLAILKKKENNFSKEIVVWIPDYFCNESLKILRKIDCKIVFYPIQQDFEPDLISIKKYFFSYPPPDIFLLVHYFGKPTPTKNVVDFCNKYKSWLVEDAVHVLKPIKGVADSGDFVLYSPHKLLPLPNGAILVARENGPNKISKNTITDFYTLINSKILLFDLLKKNQIVNFSKNNFNSSFWLIKKIIQKIGIRNYTKQAFINYENNNSHELIVSPFISKISLKILNITHTKLAQIGLLREKNQMLLDYLILNNSNKFNLQSAFRPTSTINWIPYLSMYSISEINNFDIYNKLSTKDFLPTTWPDLPSEVISNKNLYETGIKLRNTHLFLPLHQSISRRKIYNLYKKYFFKTLKNLNDNIILKWNQISEEEWNLNLMKVSKSNLLQSWNYGVAKEKVGSWKSNRLEIYFKDEKIGIVQVLEKNIFNIFKIYRINRGPLFFNNIKNENLVYNSIIKLLKIGNINKLQILYISPEIQKSSNSIGFMMKENILISSYQNYNTILINLSLEIDDIRKRLNPKWRNMLVYSEKEKLDIEITSSNESINWLCKVHEENMKIKNFSGVSSDYIKQLSNNSDLLVFRALKSNNPVSAICIAKHGNDATYLIGWTNEEGRKLKANYFLLWNAILQLKEQSCSWLDLGGIDSDLTPGITSFKMGLNGTMLSLAPSGWKI